MHGRISKINLVSNNGQKQSRTDLTTFVFALFDASGLGKY